MGKADRVLIIDDERNLRISLSMILERAGYLVTEASGAKEALAALKIQSYDLVILDLNMPGMNGLDLLPEIINLYPEMPVIILTGFGSIETAEKAIDCGIRGYMLKPVSPLELLDRVSKILKEEKLLRKKGNIHRQLKTLLYEMSQDV
jgi:DNA-binding NtrC family response regulator